MKTLTSRHKFTKEDVRAWLNRRHVSREPLPDRERMLQQLGWKSGGSPDSVQAAPANVGFPFISPLSQESLP